MKILGISKVDYNLFQCVCRVDMYVSVVDLHIMREHPNYWELRRIA
jgi:hypothetical protein